MPCGCCSNLWAPSIGFSRSFSGSGDQECLAGDSAHSIHHCGKSSGFQIMVLRHHGHAFLLARLLSCSFVFGAPPGAPNSPQEKKGLPGERKRGKLDRRKNVPVKTKTRGEPKSAQRSRVQIPRTGSVACAPEAAAESSPRFSRARERR